MDIQGLLQRKFLLIGIAVFLLISLFILNLMLTASKQQPTSLQLSQPGIDTTQSESSSDSFPSPTQSPELQAAIAEQLAVDQEYAAMQKSVGEEYPWLKKLPLTSEKYYVYFDLEKKLFIGLLYPKSGDDPEQIKADILKQLKEAKGVAVENYTFEWTVKP